MISPARQRQFSRADHSGVMQRSPGLGLGFAKSGGKLCREYSRWLAQHVGGHRPGAPQVLPAERQLG